MSAKHVGWAWEYQGPALRKLVLLALSERAAPEDGVCAGLSTVRLAKACGMSARSVQNHIRALTDEHLVSFGPTRVTSARGLIFPGPNRYVVQMPGNTAPMLHEAEAARQPIWVDVQRRSMRKRGNCVHTSDVQACEVCNPTTRSA